MSSVKRYKLREIYFEL